MKKKFFAFTVPFLIATFLAGIYLFTGCQKNVGVINSIIKFDIVGYVYDDQGAVMSGAEVYLDGVSVATTDAAGKYTIPQMLPGDYVVLAKKTGYVYNSTNCLSCHPKV
ncbi:MAG: carboxypeptidase-like regulatory domain-containing protein, partial [Mariniphaga sp.]